MEQFNPEDFERNLKGAEARKAIDKNQAEVAMTPEEIAERDSKLKEEEERRLEDHPNAGKGPTGDEELDSNSLGDSFREQR